MQFFFFAILMIFISQSSLAVMDVATPVPPLPNISFPNLPKADSIPEVKVPASKEANSKKDYFDTLFDEVETAKQTPPGMSEIKLYDRLAKESIAYEVLRESPKLLVGPLTFRPLSTNAPHAREIKQGQDLLINDFGNKSYTYKELTDIMDQQISKPNSPYSDTDWILISNALRTLKAPGESHKAHILGNLLAEYVLLGEIKKLENKTPLNEQNRSLLSSLHYDLSQLYQSMYKNDEGLFKHTSKGRLSLPIDPIYRGENLDMIYPTEFDFPFDSLVATRLDLLENALLYDPYDDYAWAQLVDFTAFDLVDPWFYNQFTPAFWANYFPFGFRRESAERLRHRWTEIRNNRDIRENRNIRANTPGGGRALQRLATVHSRPSSQLNRTIARTSRVSTAAMTRGTMSSPLAVRTGTRIQSGIKNHNIVHSRSNPHKLNKSTQHTRTTHLSSQQEARQPLVPHHKTRQRAQAPKNVFKGDGGISPRSGGAPAFHGGSGPVSHGSGRAVAHGAGGGSHGISAPAVKKRPPG